MNIPEEFTANTAYEVTVFWENTPIFTGARSGWSLQGFSDILTSDLLLKAATKNNADITDYSIQSFEGYFVPTQNLTAMQLSISGLAHANNVSITVMPCEPVSNLVADSTLAIAGDTQYLNEYFEVTLQAGKEYCVNIYWEETPTYVKGNTAWKIQGVTDTSIDGDGTVIYRALRDKADNTSDQVYSGIFTPEVDILLQ